MNKVMAITGAGEGLGRALALRFAADGDTVVALGRQLSKLEAVVKRAGPKTSAQVCDITVPDSVRTAFAAMAARHRVLDVLINNAASYEPVRVAEATDEQIVKTITTNLIGAIFCARAAIPLMRRGAHIINVSSESVDMRYPHLSLYQAAKAGLERFSQSLQQELEASGIRVSTVRAGSMLDRDRSVNVQGPQWQAFFAAAQEVGLSLHKMPVSSVQSVTQVFRALVDLPPDLGIGAVQIHARSASAPNT